ncbi:MAG: enolase C-terminal domain-like protein, partial [Actinomycetes bacterium]
MTIPALPTIDVGVPANLRLIRVAVPLRRPHAWAGGQVSVRESVIVEWTRPDGVTGWGECPAMEGYVTGGIDQAWSGLVELSGRLVADSVAAGPAGTWDGEVESIPTVSLGAMADAALDAALRSANASFHEFLGANGTPLDRTVVIGGPGADPAARLESVASARASGAACVKLKVDPSTSADLVRRCVEGGGPVAVDANGSLSADAAAAFDALGLLYIEQPFPAGVLWDDLADYQEGALTAMALDESLGSLDDLDEALAAAAADV